ncbi:MAG: SNF2-related protein, partial [Ferruginibacter sp.]
ANEIDQNPFLVFALHRVDLPALLSGYQNELQDLQAEKIFSIHDCIEDVKKVIAKEKKTEPVLPDFSLIENLLPTLPLLYTANPLFYDGDFKPQIQSHYKRHARNEADYLINLKKQKQPLSDDIRYYDFALMINEAGHFSITASDSEKKEHNLEEDALLILLAKTESKHLDSYSPSFVFLYRCFRFCNILTERGAVLPRLFHCANDNYRLQWIPAAINDSVKETAKIMLQWYPHDLLQIDVKGKEKLKTNGTSRKAGKKKDIACKPEEAINLISSLFINASVENVLNITPAYKKNQGSGNVKIHSLFFENSIEKFSTFSEKEIPNTIQLWLSRFYISKKNYEPVLQVHELGDDGGFEMEVLIKDKTAAMQPVESLFSFMNEAGNKQFEALKDLQLLSQYIPGLDNVISSKGKQNLRYNSQTFSEVLTGILPAIRLFGIRTLLPKSLQHLLKPQVTVALSAAAGKNKKYLSLDDLINFDWKVSMGDQFISPEEFIRLTQKSSGLIKIRDQYVLMGEEEIERIIKKLTAPVAPKAFTLLQAALSGDYEGASVQIDASLKKKINEILRDDKTVLPKNLNATLRHYQQRGYNWMYKNAQLGLGSLLADDMGLGKTVQVITTLLKFKEEGALDKTPALVIVPTTLLSNWKAEIQRFAPKLNAFIFHGTGRKATFTDFDIIITTYGIARTENEKFCKQKWHCVIIDEAQNIKNTETAQTKAVKKIKSNIKIAMSGTPVENRLMEYWSIFDFVNPGYLGNTNWFNEQYAKPIEINQDKKRLENFRSITSPFIMRRVKTDKSIISDLPDKIENNQYCNLSKEQASLYKSITEDILKEVEDAEGISRRGLILKLLTILKQICNHPA